LFALTRQKKRPGGGVLIWNFAERGCVRSVSRRAFKMLRLVSDTAALRSNQDTTGRAGASLAQLALRWILEFPAVTCAIPGAKRPGQVAENLAASALPKLSAETMKKIRALYDRQIKPLVHHYW